MIGEIMKKVQVELGIDLEGFFGLILPEESGFIWTNQVGGVACLHPQLEGIYVPLPACWHDQPETLEGLYAWPYDASIVQFWLEANGLDRHFTPLLGELAAARLDEAWVWVMVRPDSDSTLLAPFRGRRGVLTYENSD